MRELSPREVQLAELNILEAVTNICEKQNIRYYLMYGTLLGAIRHKGFIPWDDDVDIAMPRTDYERFLSYCRDGVNALKPLEVMHYTTNKKYIYPITRISDSRYFAEYAGAVDYGLGAFIDVYPIDGCGNNKEECYQILNNYQNMISIIASGGMRRYRKSPFGFRRSAIKFIIYIYTKLFGLSSIIRHLDKAAQSHDFNKDKMSYCTVWESTYKYVQPRIDYDEWIYVDFEGKKFRTFKNYDEVLRRIYGNYLEFPPENERVGHHAYKLFEKNTKDGV